MRHLLYTFSSLFSILFFATASAQENSASSQQTEDVLRFSLPTQWAGEVEPGKVWDVYPRPQMKRDNWENLNGLWEYAILPVDQQQPDKFQGEILVPFAVESELSGVKKLVGEDNNLWYRTQFTAPAREEGERLLLHFGAVDWEATVYLNGQKAGEHRGGYTPFSIDITPYLKQGEQNLVVKVWDPTDAGTQARGKQVAKPQGIWYTPVTGIWQTVWLEKTPQSYIASLKNTPNIDEQELRSEISFGHLAGDAQLKVTALSGGKEVASSSLELSKGQESATVRLDIPSQILWSPGNPHLYDLRVELLRDGKAVDKVDGYFGMRKISMGKDKNGYTVMLLNDEPLFQFGLLDQGWWPGGLYTAPTKEAMLYDVEMTKKWGFNMLRKHVKVEPAVFYYECDKMGMLVWQDMPNGNYFKDLRIQAWEEKDAVRPRESAEQFEKELKEMMDTFHSFPSIVVWVPFNEGWGQYETERVTEWVENYDPSRIIDSPSGWTDRGVGDMIDVHLYPGPGMEFPEEKRVSVLGEFGGVGWPVEGHMWWNKRNWGYLTFDNQQDYKQRFTQLMEDLVGLKRFGLSGAIYTQTTDVEGEVNGLMTYDRKVIKISPEETRPLIEPLYEPVPAYETIIADSEHKPVSWRASFNAGKAQELEAPFSSFDNYAIPAGSSWKTMDKLRLQKEFTLSSIPQELLLRYYMIGADMKLYLNDELVAEGKDQGGRKRHYRNRVLKDVSKLLKPGKNTISIQLDPQKKEHSFDLGLYY